MRCRVLVRGLGKGMTVKLGVNVDHVATLRQARYALLPDSPMAEPCPVLACEDARRGGADGITIHVRADRRHMQVRDAERIRVESPLPLNLEMGVTPEMLELALRLRPDMVCLVPETREEVTTEGGLDVVRKRREVGACVRELQQAGIGVSLFIDPVKQQVETAAELGAEMIELHTGAFANATPPQRDAELGALVAAAAVGRGCGLIVNAGHGIHYDNVHHLRAVSGLHELNIGHSIVARAMRVGLEQAVREMKQAMRCLEPS